MINKDFVKRKLFLNQAELERLQEFEQITINEITKDLGKHAACERYLERLIGRAIDINQHLIAEKGNVNTNLGAMRYRDTFLALTKLGVYPEDFARKIAPSAGLRNALVHEYNNINPEILRKSICEAVSEFNDYAKYILSFIEKAD